MKKYTTCLLIVIMLVVMCSDFIVSADTVVQTKVSQYALSWDGHENIPYVWAGGRSGQTLEELDAIPAVSGHPNGESCKKNNRCAGCLATGTDCSGFVSLVYKHCGITVSAQSGKLYETAKQRFTEESNAVPGDVVWWKGHVGIYIGEGKFIHTNTSDTSGNNVPYPHVSEFAVYGKPTYFLRMVSDVSELGTLSASEITSLNDKVKNTEGYGGLTTESDLTGLTINNMLEGDREDVNLPNRDGLSTKEQETLVSIKDNIDNRKDSNGVSKWYHVGQSFIGIVLIFCGVLFILAYIFDYMNVFIDISLLSIISLGKFRILDKDYIGRDTGKYAGWNKEHGVTYLTLGMVLTRAIVLVIIGLVLVSGLLSDLLLALYMWIHGIVS